MHISIPHVSTAHLHSRNFQIRQLFKNGISPGGIQKYIQKCASLFEEKHSEESVQYGDSATLQESLLEVLICMMSASDGPLAAYKYKTDFCQFFIRYFEKPTIQVNKTSTKTNQSIQNENLHRWNHHRHRCHLRIW